MMDDEWRRVWAQMTDEDLEDRLFMYFWLAMNTPNSQSNRLRELVDEAERRGQAAMVERAKLRAANTRAAITCSDHENESRRTMNERNHINHQLAILRHHRD